MQTLYIANTTGQFHDFTYRLPERERPVMHNIKPGSQIKIDLEQDHVNAILLQYAPYGLVDANQVKKGYSGLCYRIGKPVSVDAIENGMNQVGQDAVDRALEARKVGAVVADDKLASTAQQLGLRQKGPLQVEIEQEKSCPTDDSDRMNEIITVQREGLGEAPRRGPGRPRKQ
jgi:hypothetical protein